jgi:mono/diheme cytochrome c family protein
MAATDKTYRNQKTLDIVFAVSCVLMLLSIIWMFVQDYNREFKHEQRTFRDVEEAQAERVWLDKAPDAKDVRAAADDVARARAALQEARERSQADVHKLQIAKAQNEPAYQSIKADYDSVMSLFQIATDLRDEAPEDQRAALQTAVDKRKDEVTKLGERLIQAQRDLESTETQLKQKEEDVRKAQAAVDRAEDRLKKVSADFDRWAKTTAQKRWKWDDLVRTMPVLDAFASPIRIQQFTLAEYPIDYSFKYVTRYDRCMTCHLAIDRPAFTKQAISQLTPDYVPGDLLGKDGKLERARELLGERTARKRIVKGANGKTRVLLPDDDLEPGDTVIDTVAGDDLGFDPSDLPQHVRTVKLTDAQVNEFCAHPRLDLFVDANSPHPSEKFGCTSCHSGQGSATDFTLASHTPSTAPQKESWIKEHNWESIHFWDYPMLPKRFLEATCLKCHHQVTDLIRFGNKEEAPKLLRGYNLVRESGCFGCHEISSLKGGKEVGPDLRLEPSPALDAYTPGERAKMLSDPLNPPGRMRKVGPSLYRIREKTNQQWARKWIEAPRDFRPSTKMPHYYGQTNNRDDVLPDDQKGFPATEIASIAYYLFTESKDYLDDKDKYRKANEMRRDELADKKKKGTISDSELKLYEELKRRIELEIEQRVQKLSDNLIDGTGQHVALPPAGKANAKNGRKLFTERGCLACHMHKGTQEAGMDLPAVASEADFGPDLSRLAAKIAPEDSPDDLNAKRRWLVQWVMDPKVHHPRTRMPVTHLTVEEASDVAAWLLSQSVDDWKHELVPDPNPKLLAELARVYLLKAPGMTRQDVDDILAGNPDQRHGLGTANTLPLDSDERILEGPLTNDKLKWYIGRKAITRLGCFGCHEIPGFATAKPIGTPLNDWGKKDPERLAFEDIAAYVKSNYKLVSRLTDSKGRGLPVKKEANGPSEPYDKFFAEALEHHQREGFLHQKLLEPRSYDYHRDTRTWDDRLRMPQFQFARSHIKPLPGETMEQAKLREEAEAREAVMTFILGLVAEPVPSKYLNDPNPDRLAEIKGRQVLDKFNCAGCHQIRPGLFELLRNDEDMPVGAEPQYATPAQKLAQRLDQAHRNASLSSLTESDQPFPEHNAWTGVPSPLPDRLLLYGQSIPPPSEDYELWIRLTQAFRYTRPGASGQKEAKDIPAGEYVALANRDVLSRTEAYGGEFANLLVRNKYLTTLYGQSYPTLGNGESPESRKALPPPLLREGEKTQPGWLFQFLRHPTKIRPVTILRMPRFNMSDDEAMDLVNYFAAVDRINNPSIGLTYPYVPPARQRDELFWQAKSQEYSRTLKEKNLEQGRLTALQPLWDLLYAERLGRAEAAVKTAKEAEDKETDKDKKKAAEDARKAAEAELAKLKDKAAYDQAERAQWLGSEAYASDAYRLLASYTRCLNCHAVGPQPPTQAIGPPLELAATRLREDWLERWIASPQRLLIYPDGMHAMPPNFVSNKEAWPEFAGTMRQQATAVHDVLVDYPKVSELPVNRNYRSTTGGSK